MVSALRHGAALAALIRVMVGGAFMVGAASIALDPCHVSRHLDVQGDGFVAAAVGAGFIETAIGVTLIVRPTRVSFVVAVVTLLLFTSTLLHTGLRLGWGVRCGCLSMISEESVGAAVVRNILLLCACAIWLALTRAKSLRAESLR
ncbi:MAG: hypothetical protein HMLKMBBP_01245 [Planctomycetes bacterium]|nr:hypothetical protein [Planctomycetota bacterium]